MPCVQESGRVRRPGVLCEIRVGRCGCLLRGALAAGRCRRHHRMNVARGQGLARVSDLRVLRYRRTAAKSAA